MPSLHKPLYLITGSSGVGKNAVLAELIHQHSTLSQVVSVTTRWPARTQEKFAQSYFFVDQERFEWLEKTGQLAEHTYVYGDNYGTLRYSLEATLASGKTPILTVDPNGVENYRQLGYSVRVVFLDFPTAQAQKERILARQPNINLEQLDERLAKAAQERAWATAQTQQGDFTIVVNDKLGACVQDAARALGL
ncbi:MAG: guanylate kinase [Patescibacteria group bacterium]|nr:guanylate kinase [Patescibacteria group bacterium]